MRLIAILFVGLLWLIRAGPVLALGGPEYVQTEAGRGAFALASSRAVATICVGTNDIPGVIRAAHDLQIDLKRVTGLTPKMCAGPAAGGNVVIIGTLGRSELIDQLVRVGKIDAADISNRWESFFIQTIEKPWPGIENALVICGSDKRGTIYGIYDVSEQIGVSPWHYWGDVPPAHYANLFVKPGKYQQGPPSVKYRGIFINDEAPALSGWIQDKFGRAPGWSKAANYGPAFYTNVFELMLRLRANYLWPAMWNNAFNEDDTNNPALADEYGIVMGTSHQEPMLRAQKEWDRRYQKKLGSWNYAKYPDVMESFWREGIRRHRNYESIVTLGLRGADDTPMAEGGPEANRTLLEKIVGVQRKLLAEEIHPDMARVPQTWCLYKEVMDYYQAGMRVPDDVTLLWAEDNWGNLRRLPTAGERPRPGGAGVYYHFDYHGAPRSYQWINTSPIPKIWDQMSLAKEYGADRIWIVNVGHLNKGSELPLEFFMRLAWDTPRWTNDNLDEFVRLWSAREFGAEPAGEIARLITDYTRFNGRRKPELLDATTYSLLNYREFEAVVADYRALAVRAQTVSDRLAPAQRDAFYGLVLFPIQAGADLNAMYLAAAKNNFYAGQGRANANDFAAETRALFSRQTNRVDYFNRIFAGGKWNHMMDQPYIGYTNWSEPKKNNLDAIQLTEIKLPLAAAPGVVVEGSADTKGGSLAFDRFGQMSRYVDVFNAGKTPFQFTATASAPWIRLSRVRGTVEKESRLEVSVDWSLAPSGKSSGRISIGGAGTDFTVLVSAFNPPEPTLAKLHGFVEADGYVSIEAEHFTRKTDCGSNRWIKIPDYGHTLSGMRAEAPPEALATPGKNSPWLEYKMYIFGAGKVDVESVVGPTLAFIPGRPVRYAVSFDDDPPQIITIVPEVFEGYYTNPAWSESVKNNCHKPVSTHPINEPGYHTLKIWMIDPGVVLEKIIVNTGGVNPSYLGPPESFHH